MSEGLTAKALRLLARWFALPVFPASWHAWAFNAYERRMTAGSAT